MMIGGYMLEETKRELIERKRKLGRWSKSIIGSDDDLDYDAEGNTKKVVNKIWLRMQDQAYSGRVIGTLDEELEFCIRDVSIPSELSDRVEKYNSRHTPGDMIVFTNYLGEGFIPIKESILLGIKNDDVEVLRIQGGLRFSIDYSVFMAKDKELEEAKIKELGYTNFYYFVTNK